jgi:DNA-binding transcriptional LysR family regulator
MDRARRVADLWSWLPAFRAVAETEHLPTAAERLHVTPSALSRSVRLLEQEIGHPLFHRTGRNLKLSDAGEVFLAAVRDAMRLVDDGVTAVTGDRLAGALTVAAPDAVLPAVLDVAARLRERHEELVVHVRQVAASVAPALLLRGQLDVALLDVELGGERTTRERVGSLPCGIYVGRDHPLARKRRPSLRDVVSFPFAALDPTRDGAPDPWPADVERTVTLYVERAGVLAEVCARDSHVVVLPDALANDALRRVPVNVARALPLFAVRRPTLMPDGKAEVFVRELRAHLGA